MIAVLSIIYTGMVVLLFKLKILKPRPYPITCVAVAGVLLIGGVVVAWKLCAPISSRVVTTQYVVQLVPYVKGQVKKVYARANQPVSRPNCRELIAQTREPIHETHFGRAAVLPLRPGGRESGARARPEAIAADLLHATLHRRAQRRSHGGGQGHGWTLRCFPRCGCADDYCPSPYPRQCWPPYPPFYQCVPAGACAHPACVGVGNEKLTWWWIPTPRAFREALWLER
jgi:hypothetical protein